MNFSELVQKRESCREYSDRPVTREETDAVLRSALLAPSACNSQPWKIIVCDGDTGAAIAKTVQSPLLPINKWADQVGTFLVVCETKARLMKGIPFSSQHYAQIDVGITAAHLTLAAADLGLATCIMGWFDEKKIKALLNIPADITVRLVIALGYAANPVPREKKRKAPEETVGYNRW